MAARLPLEPLWWSDADAVEERRALIEAFRVEDLEAATADLRARCAEVERCQRDGEPVAVGDVAAVLLGQWSVSFQTMLADAQRGYFLGGDYDRLVLAAGEGRAIALAVRDRFLAPDRIDAGLLQAALTLANEQASGHRLDRAAVFDLQPRRDRGRARPCDRPYRSQRAAAVGVTARRPHKPLTADC